jgi:hypothetical protein
MRKHLANRNNAQEDILAAMGKTLVYSCQGRNVRMAMWQGRGKRP